MIRLVFKHVRADHGCSEMISTFTIDLNDERIEKRLTSGGYSDLGYEFVNLVGVEVIKGTQ